MALSLKITMLKSGAGKPEKQRLVLKGLGLTRPHKVVILKDTPAVRGMIRKVSHMVRVEPAE